MKKFILLLFVAVFLLTGCEAAMFAIHNEAAYGDLSDRCSRKYGSNSFYHGSWSGCVVPGVSKEWCESNGGRQRSLANRCIIPVQ